MSAAEAGFLAEASRPSWSKWDWSKWVRDPALRLCSYAAKGLWMDCLSAMHVDEEPGHLTVCGRAASVSEIASIIGAREPRTVARLLAELERNGVFSRDARGAIYSRRMVRDFATYALQATRGHLGGCARAERQRAARAQAQGGEAQTQARAGHPAGQTPQPAGSHPQDAEIRRQDDDVLSKPVKGLGPKPLKPESESESESESERKKTPPPVPPAQAEAAAPRTARGARSAKLPAGVTPASDDIQLAFDAYNLVADELRAGGVQTVSRAVRLTPHYKRGLRSVLHQHGGLPGWTAALDEVRASPFLTGAVESREGGPFHLDLQWLLRPERFVRVIEGFYRAKAGPDRRHYLERWREQLADEVLP